MSETAYSEEDLRRVHKYIAEWGNLIIPEALAAEFAKLRRERDEVAEKLAEALRRITEAFTEAFEVMTPHAKTLADDAKAALTAYERSRA